MFGWGKRSSPVLAPPYKRATGNDDVWVTESLRRQVFADVLERDEVRVADSEVSLLMTGAHGSSATDGPVTAWVVATDRALHARLTLGAGVYQRQRLDYVGVKRAEAGQDERSLTLTYWNPRTAADESWRLELGPGSPDRFAGTVLQLVRQRQAAHRAAEAASRAVASASRVVSAPAAAHTHAAESEVA